MIEINRTNSEGSPYYHPDPDSTVWVMAAHIRLIRERANGITEIEVQAGDRVEYFWTDTPFADVKADIANC